MSADYLPVDQPESSSTQASADRSRNRNAWTIAIAMLAGGVGGYAFIRYLNTSDTVFFLDTLSGWEIILALPLLMLFVVGIHELGHLLAGMWQGMRFILLIIYPFQWQATSKGIRFGWVTNIGQMGGLAITVPTAIGSQLKRQLFFMIAGGPMASLVLAVIAAIPVLTLEGRLAAYCQLVSILSFSCFLLAIIPGSIGGFMTDGMQLLDVLWDHRSVVERSAVLQITAQSMAGIRPRDWDVDAMAQADLLNSTDMPRRISAMQILLYRAMDRQDVDDLRQYTQLLKTHAQSFPDGFQQSIYIEIALMAALDRDVDQATAYLALTKGGVATSESRRQLAHAARSWASGDWEAMQHHVSAAQQAMSKVPAAGFDDLTRDQLSRLVTNPVG